MKKSLWKWVGKGENCYTLLLARRYWRKRSNLMNQSMILQTPHHPQIVVNPRYLQNRRSREGVLGVMYRMNHLDAVRDHIETNRLTRITMILSIEIMKPRNRRILISIVIQQRDCGIPMPITTAVPNESIGVIFNKGSSSNDVVFSHMESLQKLPVCISENY